LGHHSVAIFGKIFPFWENVGSKEWKCFGLHGNSPFGEISGFI
jgi:hypothetical protein